MLKPKLEEPQRAAGISADSVRGCEIVLKMKSYSQSKTPRANAKFQGNIFQREKKRGNPLTTG